MSDNDIISECTDIEEYTSVLVKEITEVLLIIPVRVTSMCYIPYVLTNLLLSMILLSLNVFFLNEFDFIKNDTRYFTTPHDRRWYLGRSDLTLLKFKKLSRQEGFSSLKPPIRI